VGGVDFANKFEEDEWERKEEPNERLIFRGVILTCNI
jgi:hypothetical protein